MALHCHIIQDILPLYADGVCSAESRSAVEEHLASCPACRDELAALREEEAVSSLQKEKNGVILRQKKKFERRSTVAGAIVAGILMIPILVCLIVNLASGAGLTWFFIVLSSLLVAASLSVVPLWMPREKGLCTLLAFTASLLLLFAVCCLYTGGRWFFVAATAVVFGLCVFFLPFAVKSETPARLLGKQKGLFVLGADTILYILMMTVIGLRSADPASYASLAFAASLPVLCFIWLIFLLARYLPVSRRSKAALIFFLSGAFLFSVEKSVYFLLGIKFPAPVFSPFVWNGSTVDGNVKWLCLLAGALTALVLLFLEFYSKKRCKK